MNRNADIRSFRPVLPALRIQQGGFGTEKAGLGQRKFQSPSVGRRRHGQIAPTATRKGQAPRMSLQNLPAQQSRTAQIGAQSCGPARSRPASFAIPQIKAHHIPDVALNAVAGLRRHDWNQLSHGVGRGRRPRLQSQLRIRMQFRSVRTRHKCPQTKNFRPLNSGCFEWLQALKLANILLQTKGPVTASIRSYNCF
jgi:hypothetical protein